MVKKILLSAALVCLWAGIFSTGTLGAFKEVSGEVKFDESRVNAGGVQLGGGHFRVIRFHGRANNPDYDLNLHIGYGFNPDLSQGEFSYQDLTYYLGIKMYTSDTINAGILLGGYNKAVYQDILSGGEYIRLSIGRSRGILIGFAQEFYISEQIVLSGRYFGSFPYIRYDSTLEIVELKATLKLDGGGFVSAGYIRDKFYQQAQNVKVSGLHIGLGKTF